MSNSEKIIFTGEDQSAFSVPLAEAQVSLFGVVVSTHLEA